MKDGKLMKTILWKVDLLNYFEDDFLKSNHDMSTHASSLHLIQIALDESILFHILHEYGKIQSGKLLQDILEINYSLNEAENDECITHENDDCVFSLIIDYETEDGNIQDVMMDDDCVHVV